MIYPALQSKLPLPDIRVTDDSGQQDSLRDWIQNNASGANTLLIPGFTQCHGVCPLIVQNYKKLISEAHIQESPQNKISLVFLSFDSSDTPATLHAFREHTGLDASWHLLQASPEDTQKLLSSLQYTVMQTEHGFEHPAQAFLFTKDLTWIGSLYGADVQASELIKLLNQAQFQQLHPHLYSAILHIKNPNAVSLIAGSGLAIGIAIMMWMAVRIATRKNKRSAPASALAKD